MDCPHCQSQQVMKNGRESLSDGTVLQRCRCQRCRKCFNDRTGTPTARLGTPSSDELLFQRGIQQAWQWAKGYSFVRWFTDGEHRYAQALWDLASVCLALCDCPDAYRTRKVWREGLEVAMKIKGSQVQRRVVWVKTEHPFTAISPIAEVHANHNVGVRRPEG